MKKETKRITIGIDTDIWRNLMQLKIDKKLRTFDDVILYLLIEVKK
jgi:hypothetical protein